MFLEYFMIKKLLYSNFKNYEPKTKKSNEIYHPILENLII